MTILENEIVDFQAKLNDCVRTKEVVQSTFDALTNTIEEKTELHKEPYLTYCVAGV